ncbi:ABC transporter substrate-binding protein [Falsiroseomonas sp. HW251]|uniref:ABC transporter substrate-binding protein n=1 Tax=Falsiroseomonas sp. HW251 TaxID=3390998 RepID=UPI003D30F488
MDGQDKRGTTRRRFVAAGGTLLAVAPRAGRAQARRRVVWWYEAATPADQRTLDRLLVQPFNQSQRDYELVMEYRGNALPNQLLVAVSAGEGPDIVLTSGPAWTQRFVAGNRLVALDRWADQFGWRDKFVPVMLNTAVFGGKLYALPKSYETQVLFYNRTLFEQRQWRAPRTGAELEAVAAAMIAANITPIAGGSSGQRFVNRQYLGVVFNTQAGPENVYRALRGEMPWNAPPFVDSVATLKSWWDKGWFGGQRYFSTTNQQAFSLMAAGRAGMAMQGSWAFQWVPDSFARTGQQLDWVPLPRLADSAPYPVFPLGIGANLAINAASRAQEGAALVLDRITDEAFIRAISPLWEGEWNLPLRALIPSGPAPEDNGSRSIDAMAARLRAETARAATTGAYGYTPWTFWPTRTDEFMKASMEEVWLGRMTPRQFCDQLDATFRQDMSEGLANMPPPRA